MICLRITISRDLWGLLLLLRGLQLGYTVIQYRKLMKASWKRYIVCPSESVPLRTTFPLNILSVTLQSIRKSFQMLIFMYKIWPFHVRLWQMTAVFNSQCENKWLPKDSFFIQKILTANSANWFFIKGQQNAQLTYVSNSSCII